mmetsp:Transcript_26128/g.49410  ORF Transcript_26128/g.49410 Transcript_26128/m.49410 type:complete len:217 (+) Transcript_26128:637-1287(+)
MATVEGGGAEGGGLSTQRPSSACRLPLRWTLGRPLLPITGAFLATKSVFFSSSPSGLASSSTSGLPPSPPFSRSSIRLRIISSLVLSNSSILIFSFLASSRASASAAFAPKIMTVYRSCSSANCCWISSSSSPPLSIAMTVFLADCKSASAFSAAIRSSSSRSFSRRSSCSLFNLASRISCFLYSSRCFGFTRRRHSAIVKSFAPRFCSISFFTAS